MTTGITNAAVEAAFEKIPVEGMAKILSKHGKEATQSLVKAIAGQMGSEAFEEAGTEFVNTLADRVINGAQSNIMLAKQAYMASGMSEEEATRQARIDVAKNVGYSGLTGAVSGGVMGAGASLASRLGRNTTTTTPAEELQKLDPLNATGMNNGDTENGKTEEKNTVSVQNSGNGIKAGKVTYIKTPYNGDKPKQNAPNNIRVGIAEENYDRAVQNIQKSILEGETSGKSFKKILEKVYENIFPENTTAKEVEVNGLIYSNNNGNTLTMGSINASYCHFANSANIPFHFNKDVRVEGNIYMGSGYSDLVLSSANYTNYTVTKTGTGASGT
jgi:hypothetical protein